MFIKAWGPGEQPIWKQYLQMLRYNTHRHIVGNVAKKALIYAEDGFIEKYFDEKSIELIKEDGNKLLDKDFRLRLIETQKNLIKEFWETLKEKNITKLIPILTEILAHFMTTTEYPTFHLSKQFPIPTIEPELLYKEKKHWKNVMEKKTTIKEHLELFPYLASNLENPIEVLKDRRDIILPEREIKEMNDIDQLANLRFELKACWSGVHYYLLPRLKEVAKRDNCSVRDVMLFYKLEELEKGIINLEERKKAYMYFYDNGEIKFYAGELAKKEKAKYIQKPKKELKGMVACKGNVKGEVIIVPDSNLETLSKYDVEGKILVTGMTNPNMMILVEKVKGIITDEGGMLCHAAIISRELNIPCIIGTKYATQILKNGDIVEIKDENIITIINP